MGSDKTSLCEQPIKTKPVPFERDATTGYLNGTPRIIKGTGYAYITEPS